ncbi:hypothetical protein Pmani_010199 [Petrolisthes manimaculis]|uniref:PHD-type domain-containing protein n=1 Tax=Petrolisthes manimaculis TaxID=1843537 RepID=A0AAE1Q342_9EUCA|nr:hypothetical protein Pmani_010199 [Petrolisthes manimaculis]
MTGGEDGEDVAASPKPCGTEKCKKIVKDADSGIRCDECELWFHAGCEQVSVGFYKELQKSRTQLWMCKKCRGSRKNYKQEIIKLRAENEEMKEENRKMDTKVKDLETKNGEMKKKLQELEEKLLSTKSDITSQVMNMVRDEMNERDETQKRANNIVVYNLPEPDGTVVEERIKEDINKCAYLLKDVLKVEVGVTKVIRFGKRNDNNTRPRPTLIKLENESEKWHVLSKAKNLKYANEETRKIGISPDMTKRQREENKKLRDELKIRRDRGERWQIKRGQLVPSFRQQTDNSEGATGGQ